MDDFGAGLESLGILTAIRQNPDVCLSLLCTDENAEFGPVGHIHEVFANILFDRLFDAKGRILHNNN